MLAKFVFEKENLDLGFSHGGSEASVATNAQANTRAAGCAQLKPRKHNTKLASALVGLSTIAVVAFAKLHGCDDRVFLGSAVPMATDVGEVIVLTVSARTWHPNWPLRGQPSGHDHDGGAGEQTAADFMDMSYEQTREKLQSRRDQTLGYRMVGGAKLFQFLEGSVSYNNKRANLLIQGNLKMITSLTLGDLSKTFAHDHERCLYLRAGLTLRALKDYLFLSSGGNVGGRRDGHLFETGRLAYLYNQHQCPDLFPLFEEGESTAFDKLPLQDVSFGRDRVKAVEFDTIFKGMPEFEVVTNGTDEIFGKLMTDSKLYRGFNRSHLEDFKKKITLSLPSPRKATLSPSSSCCFTMVLQPVVNDIRLSWSNGYQMMPMDEKDENNKRSWRIAVSKCLLKMDFQPFPAPLGYISDLHMETASIQQSSSPYRSQQFVTPPQQVGEQLYDQRKRMKIDRDGKDEVTESEMSSTAQSILLDERSREQKFEADICSTSCKTSPKQLELSEQEQDFGSTIGSFLEEIYGECIPSDSNLSSRASQEGDLPTDKLVSYPRVIEEILTCGKKRKRDEKSKRKSEEKNMLHFGLQSSHLNICYYHQDLH